MLHGLTIKGLKALMDGVINDADIARGGGEHVVVMSPAQQESMAKTPYLLSSPANAAHLAAWLTSTKRG